MQDEEVIKRVKEYWDNRGYKVHVSMTGYGLSSPRGTVHQYIGVRSNLLNGLPRGYRGDRKPDERRSRG